MLTSKDRLNVGARKKTQQQGKLIPEAIRDWVHRWHGTKVKIYSDNSSIFHLGSRMDQVPFWKQFIKLPSKSLFHSVKGIHSPRKHYKEVMYVLLNMRWPMLLSVLVIVVILTVFFFSTTMLAVCHERATIEAAFALSYHTYSTIGFGNVFPKSTCSNLVATAESFVAMLMTAVITGLVFAKFTRPVAKVAFSDVCVIQQYGPKHLALIIRVANATSSTQLTDDVIMEANFKLNLFVVRSKREIKSHEQKEQSQSKDDIEVISNESIYEDEGLSTSRSVVESQQGDDNAERNLQHYKLKLVQDSFITFRLGLALVHVINEESPFYGLLREEIMMDDMILEVAMTGVNSTLQDTVSVRYMYTKYDLRWGYKFVKLLDFDDEHDAVNVNFEKLSQIELETIDDNVYVHSQAKSREQDKKIDSTARDNGKRSRKMGEKKGRTDDAFQRLSNSKVDSKFRQSKDELDVLDEEYDEIAADDHDSSGDESSDSNGKLANYIRDRKKHSIDFGVEPLFDSIHSLPPTDMKRFLSKKKDSESYQKASPTRVLLLDEVDEVRNLEDGLPSPRDSIEYQTFTSSSKPFNLHQNAKARSNSNRFGVSHSLPPNSWHPTYHKAELETQQSQLTGQPYNKAKKQKHVNESDLNYAEHRNETSQGQDSNISIDVQERSKYLNIIPKNIPDPINFLHVYQKALYMKWPEILTIFIALFIGSCLIFGLIYWMDRGGMEIDPALEVSKKMAAFLMSVHTLTTIGYGSVSPSVSSNFMTFWVLVETIIGMVLTTLITGISWSKFARPRGHIHFSSSVVISNVNGVRCLAIRAANIRHAGDVHEVVFRVGIIMTNQRTGQRQLHDVPLVHAEWPTIKLPVTLVHIIDSSSSFNKFKNTDDLIAAQMSLVVLFTGLDTTFAENVYTRKIYFWDNFRFNAWFADFAVIERNHITVDFEKFDEVVENDTEIIV